MHPKTAYVKKERFAKKGAAKATKSVKGKPKAKAAKKATTKTKKAPAQKAYKLSEGLGSLVGQTHLSRPEATKAIWEYIKKNDLQNPKDKREILPDANLVKALGEKKPFSMMKIAGLLTKQLLDE